METKTNMPCHESGAELKMKILGLTAGLFTFVLAAESLLYPAVIVDNFEECKAQLQIPRRLTPCPAYILDFKCPRGQRGREGARGPKGPVGIPGAPGLQGPQGPPGSAGTPGPQGPDGPMGDPGVEGVMGTQGPIGPIGLTGPIGITGPIGDQGPVGAAGPTGPAGPVGVILDYAFFYYTQLSATVLPIAQFGLIPFNTQGPLLPSTFLHNPVGLLNTQITIQLNGTYRLDFLSFCQNALELTVYVNGTSTGQGFSTGAGTQLLGQVDLGLWPGSVVTLVKTNVGVASFTGNVNIFALIFVRLGNIIV